MGTTLEPKGAASQNIERQGPNAKYQVLYAIMRTEYQVPQPKCQVPSAKAQEYQVPEYQVLRPRIPSEGLNTECCVPEYQVPRPKCQLPNANYRLSEQQGEFDGL